MNGVSRGKQNCASEGETMNIYICSASELRVIPPTHEGTPSKVSVEGALNDTLRASLHPNNISTSL